MAAEIFSLGHSSFTFEKFANLLKNAGISAVADVRSSPFSKQSPWFSQHEFKMNLRQREIAYAFLGAELGGRPKTPDLFDAGVANYTAMAKTLAFNAGIDRLLQGLEKHRIAMVCSERDPLHCHRCLLVGRQLAIRGVGTRHIHVDGFEETQKEAEDRLLREENLEADDFLYPRSERLDEAYTRRSKQVAYSMNPKKTAEAQ